MDPRPVTIMPAAEQDLRSIIAYVRDESLQQALVLTEHFADAIDSLSLFPDRCPLAPESEAWDIQVRALLVFRDRVLYTVNPKGVFILRIVHGHMDIPVSRTS